MRCLTPAPEARSDTGPIRDQLQLPLPPLYVPANQTDHAGAGCPVPDSPPFEQELPALGADPVVELVELP